MPRERSPSREKAKQMYLDSKGQMKLKDIAAELGVTDTQIRKWKCTDKWDNDLKVTLPIRKRNVTKKETIIKEESLHTAVTELENSELTDKQRLFCIYYIKYFNTTKAYQKAYEVSYPVAAVNGCRLLKKANIQEELSRMRAEKLKEALLEPGDIFQKYIDIAFADITDYVVFGQEEVEVLNAFGPVVDKDGNPVTKMVNTVKFRSWTNVDGTIISEISQGKEGSKLKLYDKMKALEWLANHMDMLDTATKERLEIEKQKLVIAKIKAGNVEEEETEDDGFIEALRGQITEVWSDEEVSE